MEKFIHSSLEQYKKFCDSKGYVCSIILTPKHPAMTAKPVVMAETDTKTLMDTLAQEGSTISNVQTSKVVMPPLPYPYR